MGQSTSIALSLAAGVIGGLCAVGFALWWNGYSPEWIGFAGSIVSGVMTLGAAAFAFGLTRRQVDMQAEELRTLRENERRRGEAVIHRVTKAAVDLDLETAKRLIEAASIATNGSLKPKSISPIFRIGDTIPYENIWIVNDTFGRAIFNVDVHATNFNQYLRIRTDGNNEAKLDEVAKLLNAISEASIAAIRIIDSAFADHVTQQRVETFSKNPMLAGFSPHNPPPS